MPLAYGLAVIVAFMLALTWGALQVQLVLAGFLNGESTWSKAQKQAIINLDAYALNGDAADLEKFRANFTILKADADARDAIASGSYDQQEVFQDFKRGGVIENAIPGMVFMLDHFSSAPYLREALQSWYSVSPQIKELGRLADRLQVKHESSGLSTAESLRVRKRIKTLNEYIEPRAKRFSLSVAYGATWIGQILFFAVLAAAIVAVFLWLWMATRVLARIRGSEERYHLLFDNAVDAIVMVDEMDGRILDANRTVMRWTGYGLQDLRGIRFADLFEGNQLHPVVSGRGQLCDNQGRSRPVETQSSLVSWGSKVVRQAIIRDVSEHVESERVRRTAAEALASIAEGVIIADAERKVLSINAAATRITGFKVEQILGTDLDETRSMPGGNPIPETVWSKIEAAHHWSGEVESRRQDGSMYAEKISISTIRDGDDHVLNYVAVFSDFSTAKADRHRLEHLATHDPLTNLVNRAEFQRCCQEAIRQAANEHMAVAVLFIDLDAFKFVNDSYSHAVGDRLLKQVAERIGKQLGRSDVVGRIGGDEFTVLLTGNRLREDAVAPTERLLKALCEPFQVEAYEVALSASIGIAGFPLDGEDAQTLIANADAAMYVAKKEERNTWRFYVPTMHDKAGKRMLLATELRKALSNDEFRLVYQPSLELRSGSVVAAEALIRWQHPERGEVMPGEFIPVAESIGLIHQIDEWVMRAACRQIRVWMASDMPRIRIAINVSASWIGHPGFIGSITRALQESNIEPSRIVLEMTESAMLRVGDGTERTMQALHALGIDVAIDDFGTGYASMAYLKLPAVTYLKIDQSFVADLPDDANDKAITKAMIAMAGSLGLTTIAEGIETEAQKEFLLQAGCVEGQGYLLSYPLAPAALERKLCPERGAARARLKLVPPQRG